MHRHDPSAAIAPVPLVVDVDGTLIKTDLLHESALHFLAAGPLRAFQLGNWLLKGRASLKRQLAEHAVPDIANLPLRGETVTLIRAAQAEGRPVYLASASDRALIDLLAERIGGLAGVFATDGFRNLAGAAKAHTLVEAFGEGGYDYIGDRRVDFPVWASARRVLAVSHSDGFAQQVRRRHPEAQIVASAQPPPRAYLKALRPHQWVKNVLLFLPLLAGQHFDLLAIGATLLAFVCFCMAASSAYIVNDLFDLSADRVHTRKHKRPFAAGDVPIFHGIILGAALFIGAGLLSLLLPPSFMALLGLYIVTTLAYSLFLKRKLFVDVITLGGLYTLRVLGGVEASGAASSEWLLMVCLFLFLSLAIVKRCSELVNRRAAGGTAAVGRGYQVDDLPVMAALGTAAGYATSLVLALYISSPDVASLYSRPEILWLVEPFFLYWISRILIMANRGDLHEDPVIFACTDRISLLTGFCIAVVVMTAILL